MNERVVASWYHLAKQSADAARACHRDRYYRSSVSRAYYAMFSATTAALIRLGEPPRRREGTWTHESLPVVAKAVLSRRFGTEEARQVWERLTTGRHLRELADYVPLATADQVAATAQIRAMGAVLRLMEIRR